MSEVAIWLSYNNEQEKFRLPVNPGTIEYATSGNGSKHEVISLGEINVIRHPGLCDISFESFFPGQRYPFLTTDDVWEPGQYVDTILRWMKTLRPIRFKLFGPAYDINTPVSIEDFQWREDAGSPGDIHYKIKLREYVFHAPRKVKQDPADGKVRKEAPARPNDRQPPATYTLVPGDSLWKVAQKLLGDGNRWREIQRLNRIPDAQLKKLPVGMVIRIPGGDGGGAHA